MKASANRKGWIGSALVAVQLFVLAGSSAALQIANPDPNDPSGGIPSTPPKYEKPANGFDWRAKDRYAYWDSAWRSRDEYAAWPSETYNPEYVNPTTWKLTMMGCQNANDFYYSYDKKRYEQEADEADGVGYPGPQHQYRWKWNGGSTVFSWKCYADLSFPAEGTYYVTLEVKDANGAITSYTNPVEIKDFLIVVLGDSSASGEGAPDTFVNNSPTGRAEWVDNRCHRSTHSGGAYAAARLESANPKTSVTFLSFACSGATLALQTYNGGLPDPYENETDHEFRGVGMTAPFAGVEPTRSALDNPDFSDKIPSQVDQLWNALTNFGKQQPRRIDALLAAGGINDVRFADLATICVLFDDCPYEDVGETNFPPRPGDIQRELDEQFLFDVAKVPAGWDLLANQLAESRLIAGGIYANPIQADTMLALQYPPFFRDDDGDRCSRILYDSLPPWALILYPFAGWDAEEIAFAETFWAKDLNDHVRTGAERNGFTFVDTIAGAFDKHGICANDRFVNTPTDSAELQGDDVGEAGALATLFSKGTAHPNRDGYWAYSEEILRHLGHLTKKEGNVPPSARGDIVWAARGLVSNFNVLDNDSDEDAADVLAVRLHTFPQHGTVTMKKDGATTYKPNPAFLGEDQFQYELTDGADVRYAIVRITVGEKYKVETTAAGGVVTEIAPSTMTGGLPLLPPYVIVFDKPLNPRFGSIYFEEDDGILYFDPPVLRRKRIRLRYTLYSQEMNPLTGIVGGSMRGEIRINVRTP